MAESTPALTMPTSPTPPIERSWRVLARGLRLRFAQGMGAVPLALTPAFILAALAAVPTPLEPLAEAIMQHTPVALVGPLLTLLGGLSRTFALLGALAITLPIGGALALAAPSTLSLAIDADVLPIPSPRRRTSRPQATQARIHSPASAARWLATFALALLAVLPLVLAAPYPAQAISAVLAAACFIPALLLVRWWQAHHHRAHASGTAQPLSTRRAFLRRGVVLSGQLVGFFALASFDLWSGAVDSILGRGETLRRLFAYAPPAPRAAGFPVPGLAPEVTPISRFYLLSKNDVDPAIASQDWLLRIDGAVARSLSLSYEELLALPRSDQYVTLRCVSNPPNGPLMSNAYWSGVPLAALLRRAGADPTAAAIQSTAPDGYTEVAPLAVALGSSALLAYGINGETLPRSHGGPVRLILPGYFGFKNVKWVERITVTRGVPADYWSARGWTAARVHSVARIDIATPSPGGVFVAGFAFTGARGVSAVQVQADGGPWRAAPLNVPALSPYTWVQWRLTLPLAPGDHVLTARVLDGAGQPQDSATTSVYPNGATGLVTVHITVPS